MRAPSSPPLLALLAFCHAAGVPWAAAHGGGAVRKRLLEEGVWGKYLGSGEFRNASTLFQKTENVVRYLRRVRRARRPSATSGAAGTSQPFSSLGPYTNRHGAVRCEACFQGIPVEVPRGNGTALEGEGAALASSGAFGGQGSAIALVSGHDSSIAISSNGRVQCVLELERWFNQRYYDASFNPGAEDGEGKFREAWLSALRAVRDRCECDSGRCPDRFDHGLLIASPHGTRPLALVAEEVFPVGRWHYVDHHTAHAMVGFHSSPFRSALVISYDAGGNDGTFNAYVGTGLQLRRVARLDYYLGEVYTYLASYIPEVTGVPNDFPCSGYTLKLPTAKRLSTAGKLMGYAATGTATPEISAWVRGNYVRSHHFPNDAVFRGACKSVEGQRALAAAAQAEFEHTARSIVAELLQGVDPTRRLEGIVLTGGCALNVLANQLIADTLTASGGNASAMRMGRFPLEVYVPPAPHDGGLPVGAIWALDPPLGPQPLQYLGFRLWDLDTLDREAQERGALSLSAHGGVEYLAELLAGGPAWRRNPRRRTDKPIVAVVRGRQEYGPRALGHRSLLAVPDSVAMRERMNRLKFRQWYRPVAPMIADEALEEVFGRVVKSPYMTMAPRVLPEVLERFPALAHLDGTARHQSVGVDDEPWVHALLLAVGRRTGLAALINTSFNTRGRPIVNTVRECLKMLEELPDLDYVLIEDWLFEAPRGHHAGTAR